MIIYDSHNRRMFLQGSSGILLSIPTLVSLLKGKKLQAAEESESKPRFVFMGTDHYTSQNVVVPDLSTGKWGNGDPSFLNSNPTLGYRSGDLPIGIEKAGSAFDIAILKNNPELRSQMNIYNGLLLARQGGSGHLQAGSDKASYPLTGNPTSNRTPSIDTILSENLYQNSPLVRKMVFGGGYRFSVDRSGNLISGTSQPRDIFDSYFQGGSVFGQAGNPNANQIALLKRKSLGKSLVDSLKEEVAQVQGNSRISARDKEKLDFYLNHIQQFEAKYQEIPAQPAGCEPLSRPSGGMNLFQRLDAYLDLIEAAFVCDITRVIVINGIQSDWGHSTLTAVGPDMKAEINGDRDDTHGYWHYTGSASASLPVHQEFVEMVAKVAKRLQGITDPFTSKPMINSTLLLATHENALGNDQIGNNAHQLSDFGYISFGASDFIHTGKMYDGLDGKRETIGETSHTVNSFLITMMRAMGMKPQHWQESESSGFGYYEGTTNKRRYAGKEIVANLELNDRDAPIPGILK